MPYKESLRSSAVRLALAGGVEYGLQLAVPIILVRYLDVTAFGQYRLLWLLAGTVLGIAPAFMPQSLFYFLPRAVDGEKPQIIGNILVYLVAAGCIVGLATTGWSPILPKMATELFFQTHGISAVFLGLWVVASMLDVLPTADGRAQWQANSTIAQSIFRTLMLAAAAILSGDIEGIAIALLVVAITKLALLAYYVHTHGEENKIGWKISGLKKQLAYSLPFAFGNALFLLRIQADQWVVASMLTPAMYAIFSIASVLAPVATLIRMPVYNAMMPHLNSAHARGDLVEIARLIAKSNGATALILIPVAGGLFVTAPELINLVYTSRYQEAAPIMQVYLIGMMMNAFAVGHVLSALDKGRISAIISAASLVISLALSIVGVIYWNLIGAAFGSVLTLAFGELWALKVVARTLGMRVSHLLAWSALGPTVLGTCIGMVGTLVLPHPHSWQTFPLLLAKGTIYLALFASCFVLAGGCKQLALVTGWHRKGQNL
jgi:O-antigen/teichoic acid export membrane protein